jgi:hypothetical protein
LLLDGGDAALDQVNPPTGFDVFSGELGNMDVLTML